MLLLICLLDLLKELVGIADAELVGRTRLC